MNAGSSWTSNELKHYHVPKWTKSHEDPPFFTNYIRDAARLISRDKAFDTAYDIIASKRLLELSQHDLYQRSSMFGAFLIALAELLTSVGDNRPT